MYHIIHFIIYDLILLLGMTTITISLYLFQVSKGNLSILTHVL
jgi:hypothetical protein